MVLAFPRRACPWCLEHLGLNEPMDFCGLVGGDGEREWYFLCITCYCEVWVNVVTGVERVEP